MASNNFEENELITFRDISYKIGKDLNLVQAAGGNTSIKSAKSMLIKASGKWLVNSIKDDVFVEVNLLSILNKIDNLKEDNFIDDVISNNQLRPSTETSFHALIKYKYVLHVHSTSIIADSIYLESKKILKSKLGDEIVYVPYVRPGFPLTINIKKLITPHSKVIILENHGLIVAGDNLLETYQLLIDTHNKLDKIINNNYLKKCNFVSSDIPNYIQKNEDKYQIFKTTDANLISVFSKSFYPDHVIFLGPGVPFFKLLEDGKKFIINISKKGFKPPPYIIIQNYGLFEIKNISLASNQMMGCFIEVLLRINFKLTLKYLTPHQENELLNWDAEIYRQTIN